MSTKATLVKAKEILRERGVNRDGYFINEVTGCEVCALGAVQLAAGGAVALEGSKSNGYFVIDLPEGEDATAAIYAARLALEDVLPEDVILRWVPKFNDESQSDEEIFDLFDRAIAKVED